MKFKDKPDYDLLQTHLDLKAQLPRVILFPKASKKRKQGFYTPRDNSDT